jgi:hypothetical protein
VAVPADSVLRTRLAAEVQKMMSVGGHLRPGYSTDSMHNYSTAFSAYFRNPGDTLLALSMAYPHLPSSLQSQVAAYLKNKLLVDYFTPTAYSNMGWVDGQPRESMILPAETATSLSTKNKSLQDVGFGWTYPPHNLYALYVYAKRVAGADVDQAYGIAKAKLKVPCGVANESTRFADEPHEHNAWISGYIGFLLLQELAGRATQDAALRQAVMAEKDRLLTLRATLFSKDSPWEDRGLQYRKTLDLARNFLYLTAELGDAYKPLLRTKMQQAFDEYDYIAPFWFVGKYESMFGESTLQNLYGPMAMFLAQAHVLDASRATLYKRLDEPSFWRGDLFFIQKLVLTLEASP